jgi:invasion protein IalB
MKIATQTLAGAAGVLILGLIVGWAGRGLLTYPANSASDTSYQNWRLICPAASQKNDSCQMADDLLDDKTRQEIARLVIGKQKGKLVMGITLPLEVSLEPGVGLTLGKEAMKTYEYRTCTQVGCIVILPVDAKMLGTLRKVDDGSLVYAGADGKAAKIEFKMDGFREAQRAFDRNETRRKSWFWRMWS